MLEYTNRELSWLAFNRRILTEAQRECVPLFERVRFAEIVSSNLDEFWRVRIGKLLRRMESDPEKEDASGLTPEQTLEAVIAQTRAQVDDQQLLLAEELLPALAAEGLRFADPAALTAEEQAQAGALWDSLTALEALRVVPLDAEHVAALENGAVFLRCRVTRGGAGEDVLLLPPPNAKRVCRLAEDGALITPETLVRLLLPRLIPDAELSGVTAFRVTRDACFDVDDSSMETLVQGIERGLRAQRTGRILRIEYRGEDCDWSMFDCVTQAIFRCDAVLSLKTLTDALAFFPEKAALNWPPFTPADPLPREKLLRAVRTADCLLFHPYDSFDPVIRLLNEAAADPKVVSIKQTLYRVSGNSPVVAALISAARSGKQVTVLMEAKARFDEANNLRWAKVLEEAGCQVIYGVPGVKIHSKIILITRRENGKNAYYCHLGTGNYHDKTAKVYTDLAILTANRDLGQDAASYFSLVEGYKETRGMKQLVSAPRDLRRTLLRLIRQETEAARRGRPSGIEAKMNSLTDEGIIEALYEASQAGVPIRLVVRGICCLRPGLPGVSETIEVHSVVGRFLEHARIFRFCRGGRWETWLASADWMKRNLDRRMELMFPVNDKALRARIAELIRIQMADNVQGWVLRGETWTPVRDLTPPDAPRIHAQEAALPKAKGAV